MTGRIIHMPADDHRDIQSLLPWYLSGKLEGAERDRVQAHLGQCADCRAELAAEHRLSREIAGMPAEAGVPDVERGWRRMSQSLDRLPRTRLRFARWIGGLATPRRKGALPQSGPAPWLGWAFGLQFCVLVVMGVVLWRAEAPARYHALGAAPASTAANIVVIFKPDTPERDLRAILRASSARVVDGPTVSDAYLLHVAPAARSTALARLRRDREVVLAEPVAGG